MSNPIQELHEELRETQRNILRIKTVIEGDPYHTPPIPSIPSILIQVAEDLKCNSEAIAAHADACEQRRKLEAEQLAQRRAEYDQRFRGLEDAKSRWLWMVAGGTMVVVVISKLADWSFSLLSVHK